MHQEVKNWWAQAQHDINAAKNSLTSKDYDWACFQAQQATEKALKAIYIQENNEIRKTHDLTYLATKIKASVEIIECCSKLNRIYTEVRYPDASEIIPAKKFSVKDAQEYIDLSEKIIQWLEKKLSRN